MAKINSVNNASYSFTSDTSITSTLGNITATQGGILDLLGNITATAGNITATLGDIVLTNGKLTVSGVSGDNGQLLIAATGANPAWASLTAGAGISLTPAANSLTVDCTATGLIPWSTLGVDGTLANDNAYINIRGSSVRLTMALPATAAIGTLIILQGSAIGNGGWLITCGSGKNIWVGNQNATTSVASSNNNDSISLICTVANKTWNVVAGVGNFTIL